MIAEHVYSRDTSLGYFAIGDKLNEAKRKLWKQCEKQGDRAVKVTISYGERVTGDKNAG